MLQQPTLVLHVGSGNLFGGVETFLVTLARERERGGMTPEFALCFEGRLANEIRSVGVEPHMLGAARIRHPWSVVAARRRLARLIEERRPSVVVCHSAWTQGLFGGAVRRTGKPLAFYLHDRATGSPLVERLAKRVVPDRVLTNSHFTAESSRRLFEHAPIDVIRYPVSDRTPAHGATTRTEVRQELGTPEGAVAIVQVSRMEPYKGHTLFLDALAHLQAKLEIANGTPWEAWLVGGAQRPHEAAYRDALLEQAHRLGIAARVKFLGDRPDVPRLLSAADVFCQPNIGPEPFGIVFIEAMYAGLPIVATRMGGACEIVTERVGKLAEAHAASVGAALATYVEDPSLRERTRAGARARAAELCGVPSQMAALGAALSGARREQQRPEAGPT